MKKPTQKRKAKEKCLGCKTFGVHCPSTPYLISQGVQITPPKKKIYIYIYMTANALT
jgi:hypothetical protein